MSPPKPLPPVALIRELLTYDPETGRMHWAKDIGQKIKRGQEAGCISDTGYWSIKINGSRYRRNRLAWSHFHGQHPQQVIDHIDRWRKNDRIANLRDISQEENLLNAGEPIGPDPDPDVYVGMPRRMVAAPKLPRAIIPPKIIKAKSPRRIPQGRKPRPLKGRKPKQHGGDALPMGVYVRKRANGTTRWLVAATVGGARRRGGHHHTPEQAIAALDRLKAAHPPATQGR